MTLRTRWSLALASVPLWPIGWLLLLACIVRATLGFWPTASHPDPRDVPWPLFLPLDAVLIPLLVSAPLAVLASTAFTVRAWYERRWDWCLPLTICCFVVFVAWFRLDPGGLLDWWAD
jgi:hypothetical protein